MIKVLIAAAAVGITASSAVAGCYGTDNAYSCYDSQSGNSFSVNSFGGSTFMRGSNADTGSTWSQNSTSYGGLTTHTGRSSDGGYWRSQESTYGGVTTRSGFDSDGNYFSQTCTQWGCN